MNREMLFFYSLVCYNRKVFHEMIDKYKKSLKKKCFKMLLKDENQELPITNVNFY